jgi:DNA-binding MarR family transcriptional regulator
MSVLGRAIANSGAVGRPATTSFAEPRVGVSQPQTAPVRESRTDRVLRIIHWSSAAGRQLRRQLADVATAFDLSDSELLVVWLCRGMGWVQVELAGAIGVSPAQMSGIVERLGSRGLVEMHRPTIDRRRQVWRTTGEGAALLDRIAPHLDELAAALGDGLSADEEHAAGKLCQRLAEAATSGRGAVPRATLHDNLDQQGVRKEAA